MRNAYFKYFFAALTLAFLAFVFTKQFFDLSVSLVSDASLSLSYFENPKVRLVETILFVVAIGVIPLLLLRVNKFARISSPKESLFISSIIIGFGIISWLLRILYLRFALASLQEKLRLAEYTSLDHIAWMSFDDTHFEIFLFAGLLIGTLINFWIFKKKQT
ncbi:hypothetical protein [Kaistella antarctica]|uniref:Uncharacterized protein n=1 Tax=Kaistella antarctica TaxID=266748 RepID=A0A3S4UNV9_9FLAO|nr:hypothetical protein [Kaistella antarctica]KEY20178.1 hypothetical protein HY04_02925 [Kaistella antarctica]SEV92708.1 hypothetical protein SAMN05421765_1185 [Kaistella antarctica]VEH94975.1 Uncharacterised protein [Kaistella antarctica]